MSLAAPKIMRHAIAIATLLFTTSSAGAKPFAEVFFGFDSAELTDEARATLERAASRAKDAPDTRVVIDAHADARGAADYNVALTARRAVAVQEALAELGVGRERIVLAMYGEDGARRARSSEDRRAGIELTSDPLYVIVDDTLPVATAVTWNRPATVAEIDGPPERTARR
jgi:hypothetical protein